MFPGVPRYGGDSDRVAALLQNTGFVEDQHSLWLPQMPDDVTTHFIADGV
jgi:hypothetical protein